MEGKENTVESFTEVLCRGFPKSKLTAVYRYCRTSHRRLLSLQAGSRFGVTLTETFIDTLVSCKLSFWIAKRRLNFPVAFFVEAVLFIFKKEENKIPAIQQTV